MNNEPRTAALRSLLVQRSVASIRPERRWMTRRALTATVAAFTLAGGVTGGALSAVAITATSERTTTIDIGQMARAAVGDAQLFDAPIGYTGSGDTVLKLGHAPEGATEFIFSLRCLDAAKYVTYLDADRDSGLTITCDEETASTTDGGGGSQEMLTGGGPHTFTINTSGRFSIWGSWAREPNAPEPSALQDASLADGVVTREEYRAGYERFAACMDEAGFPLAFVDTSETVIQYSTTQEAESDGASPRCYTREFEEVDISWQIAN